jgi:hypothetical protein
MVKLTFEGRDLKVIWEHDTYVDFCETCERGSSKVQGETYCYLKELALGGTAGYGTIDMGVAVLNPKDPQPFSREVGRKYSLRDALRNQPVALRAAVWAAYRGRKQG